MDRYPSRVREWKRRLAIWTLIGGTALGQSVGCGLLDHANLEGPHDTTTSYYADDALRIEYPEVAEYATAPALAAEQASRPLALENPAKLPTVEMSLDQAVQTAVRQSPVLRSIGGTIVTTPQAVGTVYDPALAHANPQLGVEAALAAFDAQYNQSLFWNRVDQPRNQIIVPDPGGPGDVGDFFPAVNAQTAADFAAEISKTTATGASFAVRHNVAYSLDKPPFVGSRRFLSAFEGFFEAEYRQPLGQGAGTTFNRIAGPTTVPGQYNGVLIARVNEDVALADFEAAVIQLVADVEQAYWNLWTAYRVFEAIAKGREAALQTWQYQQVRLEVGTGRRDEEAQARSQYYDFEARLQNALGGPDGLYAAEQRLRYLIGLPATDGSLLKPTTKPSDTRVVFDWQSALGQALERRVEIRRQRFTVKRREMELLAARLNRRPRFDIVSSYRFRGLGDHLIGPTDNGVFDNLYDSITDGDYQEWRAGLELNFPVGLRAASTAIAHARLNLNRARAVLSETELRVSHDLSEAARQVELTHELFETNYNRYLSDLRQVDVLRRRYLDGTDNINFLLQAQRQLVTSEAEFYRALTNYNLAIRDFHRQKGSLLAYNQVQLAEGPWAAGAARDAYEKGRYLRPRVAPEKVDVPRPLTTGPFDPSRVQDTTPGNGTDRSSDESELPAPNAAASSADPQRLVVEGRGGGLIETAGEAHAGVVLEAPDAETETGLAPSDSPGLVPSSPRRSAEPASTAARQ